MAFNFIVRLEKSQLVVLNMNIPCVLTLICKNIGGVLHTQIIN